MVNRNFLQQGLPNGSSRSSKSRRQVQKARQMAVVNAIAFFDPLPPRLRRTFVYSEFVDLQSDGFVAYKTGTQIIYNLNSLYSPRSSGGHQPYGYDQMTPLYARYKVLSVRVHITMLANKVTSYDTGFVYVVQPPSAAYTISSIDAALISEKPGATILHTGSSPIPHVQNINIGQAAQVTQAEFTADIEDYAALVSASPAKVPLLVLAAWANEAVADHVFAHVRLEFVAEMYDRTIQASS